MTSRIGRFEILDSLGDSVAGNHYRAFDPATNRNVAVETFNLGTLPSDTARETFVQGLKRSAQLLHPRIASVFDVGVDNDVAYVASEHLTGKTLDQTMQEYGPFALAEIAPVIRQIGEALDHAHGQGIVHGGLEPERVLVLENGSIKVTGFGSNFPAVKTSHGAHTFVGDPKYFSPERVRGEELSHRADIFSLGTILYELLTGQAPFDSDSLITSLYRVVNEPHRPVTEIRPELPAGIDEALEYALAKQPKDRYLSCATLIDTLEALVPAVVPEPPAAPVLDVVPEQSADAVQYCDQCGSELQTKMKFCWSCGSTVIGGAAPATSAEIGAPVAGAESPSEPASSPDRNVVKIEAVPAPKPVAVPSAPVAVPLPVERDPVTARSSGPVVETPPVVKTPDRGWSPKTEPMKAAESPVVPMAPVVPAAPVEVVSSASTSKSNAVRSRPTVAMDAVVEGLEEIRQPVEVKLPARTEVAAAVTAMPPPLSGYAMSTGTKSLPAPGAVIEAGPAKPSALRALVPLLVFVVILLVCGALGFWLAPRFLSPQTQTAPPAAESTEPADASSTEAAPAEPAPTEAPAAPAGQ